ncbi:MAG: hypothetical protein FWC49_04015 [Proteobacteria bacterium]|nr:hypothetical protein [Pseudomonadota bacterium]
MNKLDDHKLRAQARSLAATSYLLGIDPLHPANEGVPLTVLPGALAGKALAVITISPADKHAALSKRARAVLQPPGCAQTPYSISGSPICSTANRILPCVYQSANRTGFCRQHSNLNHNH